MSRILEATAPCDTVIGGAQALVRLSAPSAMDTQETCDLPLQEAMVPPTNLAAAFAEAWHRLQGTIESRLTILDDATTALLDGILEDSIRQQAGREARKLAETIGIFGFVQGAQFAREVERLFAASPVLGSAQTLRLAEVVVSLRSQLEQAPTLPQSIPSVSLYVPFALIVDDDPEWAEQVTLDGLTHGFRVIVVPTLTAAHQAMDTHTPDILIVNLASSREPDAWLTLLVALENQTSSVSIIVLAEEDTLSNRLETTHLGGQCFLLKPLSSLQLFHVARQFIKQEQTVEARVLAVVDQPEVQTTLRTALPTQRFALQVLVTPRSLLEALEDFRPDVLLLDTDLTNDGGIPLCEVVRGDPQWGGLPVLFLATQPRADTVRRIFSAGADDLIYQPIVASELATHIVRRTTRVRQSLANAEADPLTGTVPRQKAASFLDRLLRLAIRYQQTFSLAHVAFDQAPQFKEQHGTTVWKHGIRRLGQLLLESFRTEDVVIRWSPTQFLIGGYGLSREDGVQRLAETLEMFRRTSLATQNGTPLSATFSAGIAQYPGDGNEVSALCHAAAHALLHAQGAGGDRILPTSWQEGVAQHTDVLVLDDDAPLAGLLLYALQTRGYHAQCLRDGQEAVEALCGDTPRLKARVILLDIGLPSLDGLTVLRQLAHDNVLQQTQAIVLTARAAEAEIVEALELGAVDYVTKPFSMPVLMRRIRRELHK